MIYDYVVTLKNERRKSIDMISILSILLSAVAFFSVMLRNTGSSYIFIVAATLLLAGLAWILYNKKKHPGHTRYSKLLIVAGITWFAMPYIPWVGFFVLLLSLLEKPAKMPLEIGFTHDRVVINNLIRKKYSWQAFNNVLLKDGLLTLDFKNNRILQKETLDEEGDAEEEEFNEYCNGQLRNRFLNAVRSV